MRALVLLCFAAIGCGASRVSEPIAGPSVLGPRERKGESAFMHTCNPCHPQGEAGLGGALVSKPLPVPVIRAKVRGLSPGDMPKFSENELSDDDVDAIGTYLKAIRKKR